MKEGMSPVADCSVVHASLPAKPERGDQDGQKMGRHIPPTLNVLDWATGGAPGRPAILQLLVSHDPHAVSQ